MPEHATLTATQFRWETGFGYFLGSVLFFFVSLPTSVLLHCNND